MTYRARVARKRIRWEQMQTVYGAIDTVRDNVRVVQVGGNKRLQVETKVDSHVKDRTPASSY